MGKACCTIFHAMSTSLDPRTQRFVARKIAKANLARTHPITSECDFSHFSAIWSPGCFMRCCASWPKTLLTETTKGVNVACLPSTAVEYFGVFFFLLCENSTASTVRLAELEGDEGERGRVGRGMKKMRNWTCCCQYRSSKEQRCPLKIAPS